MAKIARKNQKRFGSTATLSQVGKFGSLAAGSPANTLDPEEIQSLSNYLGGWFSAILGNNSPAIEDMNALCFLFAYQLTYLFQSGIPEWNTSAIYYIGSLVLSGSTVFQSLTDDNTGNNPATDATNWTLAFSSTTAKFTLEDATVPYENISGPSYQAKPFKLAKVFISMLDTGSTGSTVIQMNVWRGGVLSASARASLAANAGKPGGSQASLGSTLDLQVGDLVTVDVISAAGGTPASLSVQF